MTRRERVRRVHVIEIIGEKPITSSRRGDLAAFLFFAEPEANDATYSRLPARAVFQREKFRKRGRPRTTGAVKSNVNVERFATAITRALQGAQLRLHHAAT